MNERKRFERFSAARWRAFVALQPPTKRAKFEGIGRAVKDYLENRDMTALAIAKKHQMSDETLRKWEREYQKAGMITA